MNEQACSCACGVATFTATPKDATAGACHCVTCRKWAGGVFLSVDCGANVAFDDESVLNVWESSPWAERVSCKTCGSSLVWRTRDLSGNQVSLQAVETPDAFTLDHELFVDVKPQVYAFAGETQKLTGADVFAMFAPKPEAGL
jgi:hypothetical protein